MEANLLSALAEALTADHEVVLADDGMTIHADAASTRSSAVFFGVRVPQVVRHDLKKKITRLQSYLSASDRSKPSFFGRALKFCLLYLHVLSQISLIFP
jgi:hypothetical protein